LQQKSKCSRKVQQRLYDPYAVRCQRVATRLTNAKRAGLF
jgi:hypothetical protein